jgi:hypothetical protein
MNRLIAVAFALALASSAQAMPQAPLQQTDGIVIQVRQGCGLGRQLVDGVCKRNSTVRKMVRKCRAKKMRYVNGRCQPSVQTRPPVQPAPRPPAQPAPAPRA